MSVIFVSRHNGAIDWLTAQGLHVDEVVAHLDLASIHADDTVIGTLPVHLAAAVCARGARFLNLTLELPPEARGRDLPAADLLAYGARLEEFLVLPRTNSSSRE